MDIGSLFLILALLVLVSLYVSRPLIEKRATSLEDTPKQNEHELSTLLAERDQILNALHELDFDHALGKIPLEDYPAQRTTMLEKGAQVLRRLDSFENAASRPGSIDQLMDATIESQRLDTKRKINVEGVSAGSNGSRRTANGVNGSITLPDDELEILLATRRRVRQEKAGGFCPKCGNAIQKTDRFCPKCGSGLG